MTENEAIMSIRHRIDTATSIVGNGADGKAFEDMKLAISALEKQIPKKPEEIFKQGGFKYGKCTHCGYGVNTPMHYCDECGQAIDWSENKAGEPNGDN